ncbi:type II toxin-antitoxin system PemK/MazF family toxin [Arthrobacter sp. Br18]|uniref:type II toxin-antitoxin system PemK/MazF family toxin n=1 Tax=Arthrobacter sp. Br18 TaxID=1312954 RepID=UPI0004B85033|nr:type II toxin-antitoxin system PemK/MazF family toxin [Arthrobacter sp. Br18]
MRINASALLRLASSAGKLIRRAASPSRATPGPRISYSPTLDGKPDPGEIVWTWVPYEEDASQGKDRPVLLIGRRAGSLLGLMLTTRDRNNASASDGRYIDIGAGPWDPKGRPSEVGLDRIISVDPAAVRRVGALLPRARFDRVAAALQARHR